MRTALALVVCGLLLGTTSARAERAATDTLRDAACEGLPIRHVDVRCRNIFEPIPPGRFSGFYRLANRLHIRTRSVTVRDQLLFAPGDRYDPRLLEETARLLRDTRYLQEAYVTPVAFRDGRVDIEVVTYDVWTLNPGVSFGRKGGRNTSGFEIEELNLLGTGSRLSATRRSDIDRTSTTFIYDDRQLAGTWWAFGVRYSDNSDGRTQGLNLDHDFFALDARWAAGLQWLDDDRIEGLRIAALVHDVGKIVIPSALLMKPTELWKMDIILKYVWLYICSVNFQ